MFDFWDFLNIKEGNHVKMHGKLTNLSIFKKLNKKLKYDAINYYGNNWKQKNNNIQVLN